MRQDTELRQRVEVLVSKDEQAGSLLERPVLADPSATLGAGASPVGRQIGPYRVQSLLGAGGMCAVYRAHDSDPDRLARFRREARWLLYTIPISLPSTVWNGQALLLAELTGKESSAGS